jgi:hypothetical protein
MNRKQNAIDGNKDAFAAAADVMRLLRSVQTPTDAARVLKWAHVLLLEEAGSKNSLENTKSAATAMAKDVVRTWWIRNGAEPPEKISAGRPMLRVVRDK